MFSMFIALMAAMVGIEIMVHRGGRDNRYLRFVSDWIQQSLINSLIFSIGLSFMLTLMFPAEGLIVFTAGLFSTLAIQPYYSAVRANARRHDRKAARGNTSRLRETWNALSEWADEA